MNRYFIGISISELQQWLADDELPVLTGRVTYGNEVSDATSFGTGLEGLFKTLPAFCLDDPAGVVVAEVGGPNTWKADAHPGIHCLPLSGVKRFIPLTDDAGTALTLRLSSAIALSPAILERQFTFFRISRKSVLACRAGNMFANLFIDYGPEQFTAGSVFTGSLPRALMAAEHRKPDEIEDILRLHSGGFPATWVERAFGETRYGRNNNLIDLKSIPISLRSMVIVGVILSSVESVKDRTDAFRDVVMRLSKAANGEDQSLERVYGDPGLAGLTVNFNVDQKSGESVHLLTLALFLRWKLAFHDQRATVDPLSIMKDINDLSGVIDLRLVADALWLMGAYLGMENIAPTYRHLHRDEYPAMRFADGMKPLGRVQAWPMKMTEHPTGNETAAGPMVRPAGAGTSGHDSSPDGSAGDSGAGQPEPDQSEGLQATEQTEPRPEQILNDAGPMSGESGPDGHVLAAHPSAPAQEIQVQQPLSALQAGHTSGATPEQPAPTAPPSPANGVPVTARDTTLGAALSGAENTGHKALPVPAVADENTAVEPVASAKKRPNLKSASDKKSFTKQRRKASSEPGEAPGGAAASSETDGDSPPGPAEPAVIREGRQVRRKPVKAGSEQLDFLETANVTP